MRVVHGSSGWIRLMGQRRWKRTQGAGGGDPDSEGAGAAEPGQVRACGRPFRPPRMLPLQFVRLYVHDIVRRQLKVKFETGRACYLQLRGPRATVDCEFSQWVRLIYCLRFPSAQGAEPFAQDCSVRVPEDWEELDDGDYDSDYDSDEYLTGAGLRGGGGAGLGMRGQDAGQTPGSEGGGGWGPGCLCPRGT